MISRLFGFLVAALVMVYAFFTRSKHPLAPFPWADYSDEEIFSAVLALPDDSFKLIAHSIRPLNDWEEEKGMSGFIMAEKVEVVRAETAFFEKIGYIHWWGNSPTGAHIRFDTRLLTLRLALRPDLIQTLHDEAAKRGLYIG